MPHLVATTYLRHTPHLVVVSCRRRRETQSILNPAEFEGRQEYSTVHQTGEPVLSLYWKLNCGEARAAAVAVGFVEHLCFL